MSKEIDCKCHLLDDELKEAVYTCYNCYEADAE